MQNILPSLQWRYATKSFDPAKKLTQEQVHSITESFRLAPSSYGLQPWRLYHITDNHLRSEIRKAAFDQEQVTHASELFVICAKEQMLPSDVEKFIASVASTRHVAPESLDGFKNLLLGFIKNIPSEKHFAWTSKQSYIALGFMLLACAMEEIDACPMEGFDAEKVADLLETKKDGYMPIAFCTAGFRKDGNEAQTKFKKVRFSEEEVIVKR